MSVHKRGYFFKIEAHRFRKAEYILIYEHLRKRRNEEIGKIDRLWMGTNYFLGGGINLSNLLNDGVHPNGLGYKVMAQLWRNHILGYTRKPFVLDNLLPRRAKQNLIAKGNAYYNDAKFRIKSFPQKILKNGVWIMTSNSSSAINNTNINYIQFNTNSAADVYIAYAKNTNTLPLWLADNFTFLNNKQIETSNANAKFYQLYKSSFQARRNNPIKLGGNHAPNKNDILPNSKANYFVIVVKK